MEEKNRKMVCVNLNEEEYRSLKKMLVDMGMTIQDYLHSKIEEDLNKVGRRVRIKLGDRNLQGRVIAVMPLSSLSLSQHVGYSGFQSVEEWMGEAERPHKDRIDEEKFEIVVVKIS